MKSPKLNRKKKIIIFKSKNSLRFIWDINGTNIHIIGVLEGKEREKVTEKLFEEIIMENFPDLVKETHIQVQEAQSPQKNEPEEVHTKTYCN